MILVGLTGGIGSGKSSAALRLRELGAVIVDADAIVRELQAPGQPLVAELVAKFGDGILHSDGALDRAALANVAFASTEALALLNAIVHPAVGREVNRRVDEHFQSNRVVVMDIPLLAENPREGLAAVVVIDCPVELAVERLVAHRGFSEEDARARIAKQATREQRRAIATYVLQNDTSLDALHAQLDFVWAELVKLPTTSAEELATSRARPASEPPESR